MPRRGVIVTTSCNARHPTIAEWRCELSPGHKGDHWHGRMDGPVEARSWPRNPCNARHPNDERVRCRLAPGHKGDHGGSDNHVALCHITWPRNPRGITPAQRTAAAVVASAVLSDLEAGFDRTTVAKRNGVSRSRVQQIAAAAGQTAPSRRRGDAALVTRVRELAAAAGVEPEAWLENAARALSVYATGSMGTPNGGYAGTSSTD